MNILLLPVLVATLGSGSVKTLNTDTAGEKVISIPAPFNAIKINGELTVYLIEADTNEVIIKGNESSQKIKFSVKNNVLSIRRKSQYFSNHKLNITVKFKKIDEITVIGDATVETIGDLTCDYLQLVVKGDGKIYATTKSIEVKTIITGKGKIEVRGNFKNSSITRDDSDILKTTYN